jgi:hypothetical protein
MYTLPPKYKVSISSASKVITNTETGEYIEIKGNNAYYSRLDMSFVFGSEARTVQLIISIYE